MARMIRAMCIEIAAMGGHEASADAQLWSDLPGVIKEWLGEPDRFLTVAVTSDGSVVGFGDCRCYMLGGAFRPRKLMHIGSLYVEPDHRNRGLGKSLLALMLAWAKTQECEACELNVHVDNPAIGLYEKWGFDRFSMQMTLDMDQETET
ncbi:MAG: GNAT family N-acetyltransferase [Gammaproteobacteria bacterium]|nr:GNAT family N-acetyltransferase [Gammaproteobacteria bacterium]